MVPQGYVVTVYLADVGNIFKVPPAPAFTNYRRAGYTSKEIKVKNIETIFIRLLLRSHLIHTLYLTFASSRFGNDILLITEKVAQTAIPPTGHD
jgi:hypothetical protein